MNIVVVGQGAIGLLWYHHLRLLTRHNVSLKCSKRMTTAPTNYQFTDLNQQTTNNDLAIAQNTQLSHAEVVIFCVKSYQVAQAYQEVQFLLSKNAVVIFCHNGMGAFNTEQITHQSMMLLTTHGAKLTAPFIVEHTGVGHSDIGYFEQCNFQCNTLEVIKVLDQALPDVNFQQEITNKQWLKLAINCVINPLTSIDDVDNGQISKKKYQPIVRSILTEVVAVAKVKNVQLDLEALIKTVALVAKKTAANCSSMRSDILHQRPTEIEFINGYVVRIAEKYGLNVPENKRLLRLVLHTSNS
jgi:2-dehydropantoate 2-reductase